MFRTLIAATAALLVTSVAMAEVMPTRQPNTDRPGGTYVLVPTADAAACAAQCAQDGLCLAWAFQPAAAQSCALKAVVTPVQAAEGATSGLAARAPGFAALVGVDLPIRLASETTAKPSQPIQAAPVKREAVVDIRPPAPSTPARTAPQEEELLGGPNDAS
jgi:hypothetical protein